MSATTLRLNSTNVRRTIGLAWWRLNIGLKARFAPGKAVGDRRDRHFEVGHVERKWDDVPGARSDKRADERQRRIIGGRDDRRLGRRRKFGEALDRGRIVAIDLDNRDCRHRDLVRVNPVGIANQVKR